MTTQSPKPQPIFPDYPREQPMVDKNGVLIEGWNVQLGSLFQALQQNFKNEGIVFPPLTATEISTIQGIYTPLIGSPLPQNIPDISGQAIFDATNKVPKMFIITYDGSTPPNIVIAAWKTFTLT